MSHVTKLVRVMRAHFNPFEPMTVGNQNFLMARLMDNGAIHVRTYQPGFDTAQV